MKDIKWYMHIPLWFIKSRWTYDTNKCMLYGIRHKRLFGHTYILEATEDKIC